MNENRRKGSVSTSQKCRRFERILDLLIESHEILLKSMEEKHRAMRTADMAGLQRGVEEGQRFITRISKLEEQRRETADHLIRLWKIRGERPITVRELAGYFPPTQRESIKQKAEMLRELIENVRTQGSVVKSTGEALAEHLSGLVQRFRTLTSATGLYTNHGRIGPSACLDVCTLDVCQ